MVGLFVCLGDHMGFKPFGGGKKPTGGKKMTGSKKFGRGC